MSNSNLNVLLRFIKSIYISIYFQRLHEILDFFSVFSTKPNWTADYVAPVNPCRNEDTFCSTRCRVLQLKGEIQCDFCVCSNPDDYGRYDNYLSFSAYTS